MQKWPKEAVRELINLFKENEYLWKTENVKQSQKSKINKSWSTIAARMSIILNKPVTELDCQNKVINLKKYFWRENKRLRNEGKKTGTSKWCFYDSFSFLTDKAITKLGDYPIDALSEPNITGDMTDNILFSTTRRTSTRIEYLKNLPKETEVNATDDSTSSAMPSLERVAKRKATQTTNTPVRKRRIPDVSQAPVSLKNIELESTDEQTPTNSKSAEVNTMEDSRIDITDVQPNQKTIQANREAKFMNAHFIRRSADRGHTLMHSSYAVVDPFNSPIQDECQNFCLYVMHKMRTYSTYTRCAVQHAISDILFNADVGLYNCAASSSTLNVSTEPRHSNLYPHVEITSPISVCKTEDISDLDDEDMLSTCLD
ncbi:uncharacterized protein LOC143259609 [Megalopta genalis]|uniref:uncharacterized protein LOC143259609 n=1 Tax=Megalopta genalis TaxID=115081 RepID=UPI003FD43A92